MSKIGLQPTQTLAEAGQMIFAHHFHDFLKHETGTRSGKDNEFVHDMRVATRRMRATIRTFGNQFSPSSVKFLENSLKKIAQNLGAVRDLDVFIEKLTTYQQNLPLDEQSGLTPLVEYCYLQREIARTKMLTYLDSKAYERFKTKAACFIKKEILIIKPVSIKPTPYQIHHVAPVLIYSRYEAIRAYEPFLTNASVKLLHQLRIDFKHFRYTLENFQEILGNESVMVLSEIKAMQDHLGNLNDTSVACQFVEDFLHNWKRYREKLATTRTKKPTAIVRYLNVKIAEQELLLTTFPHAWHQFNSLKLRQHLALSIAVL